MSIRRAFFAGGLLALLALAPSATVGAAPEHIRARVLVLDFDPLIEGVPLTVNRA